MKTRNLKTILLTVVLGFSVMSFAADKKTNLNKTNKIMRTINHFGIPTKTPQAGETYIDGLKVHLTDFSKSGNKIEFLRFEEGSWMPKIIQEVPHIAYEVANLEAALEGKEVIVKPMEGGPGLQIAFIVEEGIPVELMCFDKSVAAPTSAY